MSTFFNILIILFFCGCSQSNRIITVNFETKIIDIDPIETTAFDWNLLFNQVFDSLFFFENNGEIGTRLLDDWSSSKQFREYIFVLKTNIHFSDGDILEAKHVKKSFFIYKKLEKHELSFIWDKLEEIKIVEKNKLIMKFSKPIPDLPYYLASPYSKIYKEKDSPMLLTKRLGTSAFFIKELIPYKRICLEKNKYFKREVDIQGICFERHDDVLKSLVNKKIDFGEIARKQVRDIDAGQVLASSYPMLGNFMLGFNLSKPPFNNILLREAISKAIDKTSMVEGVKIRKEFIPLSIIPFGLPGYLPDHNTSNIEEAKEIIKKIPKKYHPTPKDMTIHLPLNAHSMGKYAVNMINRSLSLIGLPELKIIEVKEDYGYGKIGNYYHFLRTNNFNMYIRGMIVTIPSSYYILRENILPKSPMNFSKYRNDKIVKLVEEYENGNHDEKVFREISKIISRDIPFVVLGNLFYNPVSRLDTPIRAHALSPNYINFADSF